MSQMAGIKYANLDRKCFRHPGEGTASGKRNRNQEDKIIQNMKAFNAIMLTRGIIVLCEGDNLNIIEIPREKEGKYFPVIHPQERSGNKSIMIGYRSAK